jgi:hypothetical protein
MTDQPLRPDAPLQIHTPCPKSWGELTGDGKKRFCSACCLHVHDAAQLTRDEARALVTEASARVCMRFVLDPEGAPIFRDSAPRPIVRADERSRSIARFARLALSAAAGVLAACHGSLTTPAPSGGPPSKMGKVHTTELLGDVAVPQPQLPERMGEATVKVEPAPAPAPVTPPTRSDD